MARRVFFSFHFLNDFWRTQQVRNIGSLEGQTLCSPNDWEAAKRKGDAAIKAWIDDQMHGKSCVIVLVGAETANRPWVIHEISKGWNDKRAVLGIRIDKLLDNNRRPSVAGVNPFSKVNFSGTTRTLANVAPLKVPTGADSKAVYASIANNIEAWIEEAIRIRTYN
ncbi:MAG: molecular chaperone Tir [Chloroflexia bacterium]|nr:molecular chaperone Tir [Chloroflexia bacterium]